MVIFGPVGNRGSIGIVTVLPPPPLGAAGGVTGLSGDAKIMEEISFHFRTRLKAISINPIQRTARCLPLITLD